MPGKNKVTIHIDGDNRGLGTTIKDTDTKMSGLGTTTVGAGKLIGGAMIAAGASVAAFGLSSVKAYETAGKETMKLQRLTGGTAEEMSTLRFIAQQSGVTYDTLTKSITILSKGTKAQTDELEALGVSTKNADGSSRPFSDTLADLAEQFAAMPNGAEKNAAAMRLFGKSGADMVPLLNKGRDGIAELTAKAKEMGVVLDQEGLESIKKQVAAQRDLSASVEGLKLQVGQQLLPVMETSVGVLTKVTQGWVDLPGPMKDVVMWTAAAGGAWMLLNNGPLGAVTGGLKNYVTGVIAARTEGASLGSSLMTGMNPALIGATAAAAGGLAVFYAWSKNVDQVDKESTALSATLLEQAHDVIPTLTKSYNAVLDSRDSFRESFMDTGVTVGQVTAIVNESTGDFDRFRQMLRDAGESPAALKDALFGTGEVARRLDVDVDGLRSRFSQLDPSLQAVVRRLLEMGDLDDNSFREFIDGATDLDQAAMRTAENVESMAKQMRDTVGATNLSSEAQTAMSTALGKGNPSLEERQQALLELAALYPNAATAAGLLTEETEAGTDASEENTEATKNQKSALEEYQTAVSNMFNPLQGLQSANEKVAEAQKAATDALNEHGRKSPEYIAANQAVIDATVDQEVAQARLKDAFDKGDLTVAGMQQTLMNWVAQGRITEDQAKQQAFALLGLKDQADKTNGTSVVIPVKADTEDAKAKLRELQAMLAPYRTGTGFTITGGRPRGAGEVSGRAHGGPVAARSIYEVVEQGHPEVLDAGGRTYLLTGSSGGRVTALQAAVTARSATSSAIAAAVTPAGASGAASNGMARTTKVEVQVHLGVGSRVSDAELRLIADAVDEAVRRGEPMPNLMRMVSQ